MSAFEASHISPNVKKAIFKKTEALNKIGLGGNKPGLDIKAGDTVNATPSFDTSVLEPTNENGKEQTNSLSYQLVRNTFARLSVDLPLNESDDPAVLSFASYLRPKKEPILKSGAFQTDESGFDTFSDEYVEDPKRFESFNRFGTTTQMNTPLAFNKNPFTNDKKFIWRGHTGITSVSITQKSFFIKEVQIGWECPDPIDFEERVLPYFLQHGRFMVVEFGWGLDSDIESKIPPITENNMKQFFKSLQERNNKSVDSYQAEAGTLTTYNYSVTEEGGYKGTMTLTSRGENVLFTPIQNVDDEEESLPAKTFTRTTDSADIEKAVDNTRTFRATINNLEDFVIDYLRTSDKEDNGIKLIGDYRNTNVINFLGKNEFYYRYAFKNGVMYGRIDKMGEEKTGRFNSTTKRIKKWYGLKRRQMFCSWGWFEDVILNSFFQVKVDTNEGMLSFQEIRSVHTPYKYETLSDESLKRITKYRGFNAKSLTDITDTDELVSNRCNNSKNLYSLGLDSIILPGQFFTPKGLTQEHIIRDITRGVRPDKPRSRTFTKLKQNEINDMERRLRTMGLIDTIQTIVDEKFKKFGEPFENYGRIRNMVFDIDYLKSHFENINSVEEGLRSLWSDVASKYGGFFNFYIHQDENNNGKIGIVDGHYMNPIESDSELMGEGNIINYSKYIEGKKELGTSEQLMEIGVFSKDSIVSSYSLNLKLTKEAATLALYGNQGKGAKGNFTNPSSLYDIGINRYSALQNAIFPDLQDSDSAVNFTLGEDKVKSDPILIKGFTTPINPDGRGLDITEYIKNSNLVPGLDNKMPFAFKDVTSISSNIAEIKKEQLKKLDEQSNESESEETTETKTDLDELYPLYYDFNGGLTTEMKKLILTTLNHSIKRQDKSNWIMQKTVIPIDLDLTIDGIGGLKPGNLFKIDFLPTIYRKYTYFQIFSINHSITSAGWTTSMNAKMKLDFPKMITDGLIKIEEGETPLTPQEEDVYTPVSSEVGQAVAGVGGVLFEGQVNPVRTTGDPRRDTIEQTQTGTEYKSTPGSATIQRS